jgi:choline-glycine betaine transporter
MTMKSAFYPIIGEKIFGWMGDLLDIVSVATSLFGVCTSLGLGVRQLNAGFARLNPTIELSFRNEALIVWSITLLSTISVLTGIKLGIRRISEINLLMGQLLMLGAIFQDNTWCVLVNCPSNAGRSFFSLESCFPVPHSN